MLETQEGLTAIGSPAYLNIRYGGVPEPNVRPVTPEIEFPTILSHRDRLAQPQIAAEYCQNHALQFKMKSTSWNNIPKSVQDMFATLVEFTVQQDLKAKQRKGTTNERIITLQKRCQKL